MIDREKNTGKKFERLAQLIFQEMHNQEAVENVRIEHNVNITGKCGQRHQVDLYWEYHIAGITYSTVVQVKDWNRAVPQGELILFNGVIGDIPGQPRGVFVSKAGFQKGARKYAEDHGIKLYELREMVNSDYSENEIRYIDINYKLIFPIYSNITLIFDDNWNMKKGKEAGIHGQSIVLLEKADNMMLYDNDNMSCGTIAELIEKTTPQNKYTAEQVEIVHEFEEDRFLKLEYVPLEKIKINGIKYIYNEIICENKEIIDLIKKIDKILKDIILGDIVYRKMKAND